MVQIGEFSHFREGVMVEIGCYKRGCETIRIPVILGRDETEELYPMFCGPDEFKWAPGTPVKEFRLVTYVNCPCCKTLFAHAIIVSNGSPKEPTSFGYDPEPA
jgi:hypothetical protein